MAGQYVVPAPASDDADDAPRPDDGRVSGAGVARGALSLGIKSLLVKGSQTAVLLILAALLAPEALGVLAVGTMIVNVTTVLSGAGVASALVYWRGEPRRAAGTAVTLSIVFGLMMTAVAWFSAPWLAGVLHAQNGGTEVIRGLVSVLTLSVVTSVSMELLRRDMRWTRRVTPEIVGALVGAVAAVTLALNDVGVMSLVVGQIVQTVVQLVIFWIVLPPIAPGWDRDAARTLLAYGVPLAGTQVLDLVQLNLDYVIVARFLDAAALGEYSLAFRLVYLPYLSIAFVIGGAAFPYLCRLRGAEVGTAAMRITALMLAAVTPICLGIVLFAPEITLLGDKWQPAVASTAWLGAYALVLSMVHIAQIALQSAGRTGLAMGLQGLHVVVLGAVLLAVVELGITAVAIAQLVVVVAILVVVLTVLARVVGGVSPAALLADSTPVIVGGAAMVLTDLVLLRLVGIPTSGVVHLLLGGTLTVIAYAVPVWLLGRRRFAATMATMRAA